MKTARVSTFAVFLLDVAERCESDVFMSRLHDSHETHPFSAYLRRCYFGEGASTVPPWAEAAGSNCWSFFPLREHSEEESGRAFKGFPLQLRRGVT